MNATIQTNQNQNLIIFENPAQLANVSKLDKYFINLLRNSLLATAFAIAYFCKDRKHMKLFGMQTEEEFFMKIAGLSRRQGHTYKKIGEWFLNQKQDDEIKKLEIEIEELPDSETAGVIFKHFIGSSEEFVNKIGVKKFEKLLRYDPEFVVRTNEEGAKIIIFDDEYEIPAAQIIDETQEELAKVLDELKKTKTELNAAKAQLAEEKKLSLEQKIFSDEKLEEARILERQFGKKQADLKSQRENMKYAIEAFGNVKKAIFDIKLQEDSNQEIQLQFLDFIKNVSNFHDTLTKQFGFVSELLL